ncbi:hypothetical protein A2U01_0021140, partial [Trifolium medium]|nr:hypothetical protein [Trifolium medium]
MSPPSSEDYLDAPKCTMLPLSGAQTGQSEDYHIVDWDGVAPNR